jgi:hypothetical protein
MEAPPAPYNAEALKAQEDMVGLNDGLIPPLSQLRFLSLGGARANTFLRAVRAEAKTCVAALADASGMLSRAQLSAADASLGEAVQGGLKWLVLHWQCVYAWPALAHLVQAALNAHSRQDQSEVEMLLELGRLRDQWVTLGKAPDWKAIETQAVFSNPPCASYIDKLATYVKGQSSAVMEDLSCFSKAFAHSETSGAKKQGSEFFTKLNSLSWGKGVLCPYLLNAAIEANLVAPPNKVVDGVCRLILPSNLAALASKSNLKAALEAEALMVMVRDSCSVMGVDSTVRIKCVGKVDCRCIDFLCKKAATVWRSGSSKASLRFARQALQRHISQWFRKSIF